MEKKEKGTRITTTYCQKFHKVVWEQACHINPDNPMAVAGSISDVCEALEAILKDRNSALARERGRKALSKIKEEL